MYATLANPVPEVPTGNTDRKCPTGWLAQNRLAQNRLAQNRLAQNWLAQNRLGN